MSLSVGFTYVQAVQSTADDWSDVACQSNGLMWCL